MRESWAELSRAQTAPCVLVLSKGQILRIFHTGQPRERPAFVINEDNTACALLGNEGVTHEVHGDTERTSQTFSDYRGSVRAALMITNHLTIGDTTGRRINATRTVNRY